MEAIYQNEKKQKEIELQESKLAKKDIEVKQQRTQKIAFICGFVLMMVLSVVIFKSYRDKQKANILLAKQKHEIEEKNEELNRQNEEIAAQRDEIETQRDEITAQRDLVTKQKERIEEIHEDVIDSIRYAERIQRAVIPTDEFVDSLGIQYFIIYKPRDIVSGDFYWFAKRKNWILAALADCTGHGVPGAFMSMLGISFLNEIIAQEEVQQASHALDKLREYVIFSLHQKGAFYEQKDGMDIAFVAIDLNPQTSPVSLGSEPGKTSEVYTVHYAGANNPLYFFRNGDFIEYKADTMPIAIYENMTPFTNHEIQMKKDDVLYLFSDGFIDQFGGDNGKKFLKKRLKEILTQIQNLSMPEQKIKMVSIFENWKGGNEQIDDVSLIGIKI
ncbi:MAG: SpoIIE family protein phosphatase [Bacteroidia bacterium]|nr:SpoIIE family protein phosphatase [Bacteroidia bacterium]